MIRGGRRPRRPVPGRRLAGPLLAVGTGLAGCLPLGAQEPGMALWVGLYDAAQIEWMSNEYAIQDLCPTPVQRAACWERVLAPKVVARTLRRAPRAEAPSLGELLVLARSETGLEAHFLPPASDLDAGPGPLPVRLDVVDPDWGYGPYFHHTFLDRTGDWFLLPAGPWREPAWVRLDDPELLRVTEGTVYRVGGRGADDDPLEAGSWVVLLASADSVVVRLEQPADMWCQAAEPPALRAAPTVTLRRSQLLDEGGHALLRPKYTRGC